MKITLNKFCAFLFLFALLGNGCTITVEDDSDPGVTDAQISGIETFGWIYSELIIEGTGMDTDCGNSTVSIINGSTTLPLTITDCIGTALTAWIPEDADPGVYNIEVDIDGTTFTAINGTDMEVEVKNRPVILTMSKTTIEDGETITIGGLHLLNPTSLPQNDPTVWIMKSGYTNTVSEITVDSDGNGATIVIDEGIDAGEYDLLLTTDEWSNRIAITII